MSAVGVDESSVGNAEFAETLDSNAPSLNPRPNMSGLDVSFANQSQWYCYCPLENILGKRYSNLDLHLTRFSLPQITMSSETVSFRGYSKEIPGKVINSESKELTLEYIVDEYWQNYKSLYAWQSCITGTLNPVTDDATNSGISPSEYITMRIYLLNNYKKKVLQFEFQDCWCKVFNDIALDFQNTDIVTHSFTFAYSSYKMTEI